MPLTTYSQKIKVSELDFPTIKENLIGFLQGQETFKDYNYDGSALSVLIDVLAYNTHYNAIYNNLAVNEMFLDSASKRSSVLSIANNFSYTPRSSRCSSAVISMTVLTTESNPEPTLTISKQTPFATLLDGSRVVFYTHQDYSAKLQIINGQPGYQFPEITIHEGNPVSLKFVSDRIDQTFIIPNKNIDLDTISVIVQETSETTTYTVFDRAQEIIELTNTSPVYFIKELEDGRYQLSFGRNNFGRKVNPGNIVSIIGYETNLKNLADGAKTFSYQGSLLPGQAIITTIRDSSGGADKESLNEIKDNVTNYFFNQHRAVTEQDYSSIIKREFDFIDAIRVWGGEKNDPPEYGKVFICVKPENGQVLSSADESYIANIISPYSMVSTLPVFIQPKYLELSLDVTAYYDSSATERSSTSIQNDIITLIESYRQENLQKFDGIFRYSKLTSLIDRVDRSVRSNITTVKMNVRLDPIFASTESYDIYFVNPVFSNGVPNESVLSTGFYIPNSSEIHYIDDDGQGSLRLFNYRKGENSKNSYKNIVDSSIGAIDYSKGHISIPKLNIQGLASNDLFFAIKTSSNDIISVRNYIVDIPPERVKVSMIANVSTQNMLDYQFTASRT